MNYYLLKLNTNWADEMDIDGIYVIDEDKYNYFKNITNDLNYDDEFYMSVGANEEIECEWRDICDDYSIRAISRSEHEILVELGIDDIGFAGDFFEAVIEMSAEIEQ